VANAAFAGQFGGPNLWVLLLGAYAFAWQVYGDFSGYSDIARGSAQMLGFHFMVNFRQPFLSRRLQEFWRRWHISLSTWLRDYLYIPLGGSAGGTWKTSQNLLATMLLGGLWHGANWTFVVFGAIHGVVLSAERFLFPAKSKPAGTVVSRRPDGFLSVWAQRILTFNLFCLSLVFFRAPSLGSAVQMLGGLFHFAWQSRYFTAFLMLSIFSLPLFLVDLLLEARNQEYPFAEAPYAFRTGLAIIALIVLAYFSASKFSTFIYFQF
jgi:D-alanyl-lipoteichoic acid acyltransferase DltB (MBOAT superfamily)